MAIDSQGNFIVADNYQNAIYRVSPDGRTKLVSTIPPLQLCPDALAGISIAIDRNGDYLVTVSCPTGQLMRVTPSGEVTVIFDYDPQIDAKETVNKVVTDPTGQGYYVTGDTKVYHISPTGEVKLIADGLQFHLVGLTLGPSGDLFIVSNNKVIYQVSPDGSQKKVLFQGAPLALPVGIQWIGK
jgi:sugar lactone lactonase YvrE